MYLYRDYFKAKHVLYEYMDLDPWGKICQAECLHEYGMRRVVLARG